MAKICIAVLIVTVVCLVVFQFIDPNKSTSIFDTTTTENTTSVSTNTGSFTIQGYVINPGTYLLSLDDTVTMADLITAAGGVNSNADDRCYYLEAEITENETYYIPTKYDSTDVCGDTAIEKVNVNSDDSDELQNISGIGSVLATSIINYRETSGSFKTLEDLKNVTGIGNSKFAQIKDYVILHE